MDHIDLTRFDDGGFTVQFIGPPGLIAVDTLVETLSGFAEALAAIGIIVDPTFHLEVYVDSLTPGSVKIGVRLRNKLKSVDGMAVVGAIVIGLLTNYLYDQVKPDEKCQVVLNADKVTIKGDHCDVTIAREVYDLSPRVEAHPKVANGVRRALQAVKKDKAVDAFGVDTTPSAKPSVYVDRPKFDTVLRRLNTFALSAFDESMRSLPPIVHETRIETVRTNLIILKASAWLQRGKRKWTFNWQGIKISAAIADPDFFTQLAARSIALHQGDALDADLDITQRFSPAANVWENVGYRVAKVYSVRLGET